MPASENFKNNIPTITNGNMDPLTLSVIKDLEDDENPPFIVNQDFLKQMIIFCSSEYITPIKFDKSGKYKGNDLETQSGIRYINKDGQICLIRKAPNCGPNDDQYDILPIKTATGTYAYYGFTINDGSVGLGSGEDIEVELVDDSGTPPWIPKEFSAVGDGDHPLDYNVNNLNNNELRDRL